jgi:hypothetical protein
VVELLQIIFFMRAQRRGIFDDYLGLAIFTALMLPINYSASFLLLAEALWFVCLLAITISRFKARLRPRRDFPVRPGPVKSPTDRQCPKARQFLD